MAYAATVICDSVSEAGVRLITVEATYPLFIHNELLTHRDFSRSSSSNRAIPFSRLVRQVLDDPVIPVLWGSKAKGMVAGAQIADPAVALAGWLQARDRAVEEATSLDRLGVHKQTVNRLLGPFQWITTLITATEWDNFFNLRRHRAAQPEMQQLATLIGYAIAASTPTQRTWHLPYLTSEECDSLPLPDLIPRSVARCARVSFANHDGTYDPEQDLALYQRLVEEEPRHASPLEHVAGRCGMALDSGPRGEHYYNLVAWASWRYCVERLGLQLSDLAGRRADQASSERVDIPHD